MPGTRRSARSRFVVEIGLEGAFSDVRELTERARSSAGALTHAGTAVRFVRTVYLAEDETCLLVFEAQTPEGAREAARIAGLAVKGVSAALTVEGP